MQENLNKLEKLINVAVINLTIKRGEYPIWLMRPNAS